MGRLKSAILSVTCLALLGLSLPVIAQESTQQEKPASLTTTKTKHGIWKQVADGIWEAYIPKFSDDDEKTKPEFAVLRLTSTTFAEFQKDKVAFLNKYKVFNVNVNKLALYSEAKPKNEDPPNSYNYVTLAHWPSSTAAAQVYQGWSEPAGDN
jgi:hypothetical protein